MAGAVASHYDPTSCSGQCAADAVYCTQNVGFTTEVPPGCALLSYDCVPVGTSGADCTVYFCCPSSDAGASPDGPMDASADGP
jgi:hypothetical protein